MNLFMQHCMSLQFHGKGSIMVDETDLIGLVVVLLIFCQIEKREYGSFGIECMSYV